jgi:hypothetical protein
VSPLRTTLVLVATTAAVTGATPSSASFAAGRTVTCDEIIDHTPFPYIGRAEPGDRYRLVLGAVSVPPPVLQIVETPGEKWPYWRKAGLVVRSGTASLTITIPKAWRKRAAIDWGYKSQGAFSSVRIVGCGTDPKAGNAYSGGFVLRDRSLCLPLVFSVGGRSQTVRFGLGRRCP